MQSSRPVRGMLVVHVDKDWAWATAMGGFLANIIIGGLAKSFGIVMEEFQEVFDCPAAYTTLAGGLIYTFMYTSSLLVHLASERFGTRPVVAVGAIGCSACLVGAAYAPNVGVWVTLIGGGLGLFLSCIYFSSFVVVGRCFDKHLGLATGVSVSGISVGQVAFPAMVSYLIDRYTIRGATLLAGALLLHFLITAALMPSTIIRPPPTTADSAASAARRMNWPLLSVFVVAKIFSDVGDVGLSMIYPAFGKEAGLSNLLISYAIAVGGAVDLASRLSIGWCADKKFIRRSFILVWAWVLDGTNGIGMSFVTDYPGFCVCYGLFGVCSGTAMALMVVVLTDFVGPEQLPKAFAIMMVAMGVMIAPGQFVLGYIKDVTGSYRLSMRIASVLCLIGAVCLMFELPVRWYGRMRARKLLCNGNTDGVELTPMAEGHEAEVEAPNAMTTSTHSLHIIANSSVTEVLKS